MAEAAALTGGECVVLSPDEVQARLPRAALSDPIARRTEMLASFADGERDFYGEQSDVGKEALLGAWESLRADPALLPDDVEDRSTLYRSLLLVLRLEWERDREAGEKVAAWLATYMPEQIPSVKRLPPVMAGRASTALEEARNNSVKLSAPAPEGCSQGRLRVDGLIVGDLPVTGQRIARGFHAYLFECKRGDSWMRRVQLDRNTVLPTASPEAESALVLGPEGVGLRTGPGGDLPLLGARLARSLDVDAVLFVPAKPTDSARLAAPAGESVLRPNPELGKYVVRPAHVFHPRGEWKRWAKWSSLAAALLLGAGAAAANAVHLDAVDSMALGTVDRRDEAADWELAAMAGYGAAGAAALLAATFFVWDAIPPEEPETLF